MFRRIIAGAAVISMLGMFSELTASTTVATKSMQCSGCDAAVISGGGGACTGITVDWITVPKKGKCVFNEEPPPNCVAQGCTASVSVVVTSVQGQTGVQQCFQATVGVGSGGIPQQGPVYCRSLDDELDDGSFTDTFDLRTPCGDQHEVFIQLGGTQCSQSSGLFCTVCE